MSRVVALPNFYSSLIQEIEELGWSRFVPSDSAQNIY